MEHPEVADFIAYLHLKNLASSTIEGAVRASRPGAVQYFRTTGRVLSFGRLYPFGAIRLTRSIVCYLQGDSQTQRSTAFRRPCRTLTTHVANPARSTTRQEQGQKIRVLLADNHAMFREGLRAILDRQSDITVVSEAEDGLEATSKAGDLAPDIVLMDISMPIRDGVEAARIIAEQNPRVGIIILTMNGGNKQVMEALKAGARAYIIKSARAEDLIEAIRTVHRGGAVLDPGTTNTLLREFRHLADDSRRPPRIALSDRDSQILYLVAQGKSNKQIADVLSLSDQTIKNRLSAIYRRLKVANRAEAVTYAIQQDLISLP